MWFDISDKTIVFVVGVEAGSSNVAVLGASATLMSMHLSSQNRDGLGNMLSLLNFGTQKTIFGQNQYDDNVM